MTTTDNSNNDNDKMKMIALVFGASGEQGRAVMEGLVDYGFDKVYGFTRLVEETPQDVLYLQDALGCTLVQGDIANADDVQQALVTTRANCIFLVTTTELPSEIGQTTGCWNAMEAEYEVIQLFFDTLVRVHAQDGLPRHVIFSTKDNVQKLCHGKMTPMDDGSLVPHYSAKGKGADYALELLQNVPGLTLTLITFPFLYSNFLGFFTPLPVQVDTGTGSSSGTTSATTSGHSVNQWSISASLGDGSKPLDMMSVSDLSTIVPYVFQHATEYASQNLRLTAGCISMDAVAAEFSDLFGKDVIYNPLLANEVAALPFPSAPAMAQMCDYLQQYAPLHDLQVTKTILASAGRQPQSFQDWLLTHSDASAFTRVGLDLDAPEIHSVVVFGATSPQGRSVIQGLLQDARKRYTVRAACLDITTDAAKALQAMDPERVTLVQTDLDNVKSCQAAAEGVDGAFLVTDFYQDLKQVNVEQEQQHAKNVIDACEAASSIKHLVFSTMDSVESMLSTTGATGSTTPQVSLQDLTKDAKAKAAAYARTKQLSVTYVILPCYSELFLDMIQRHPAPTPKISNATSTSTATTSTTKDDDNDDNDNSQDNVEQRLVLTIPLKNDEKVMCMSMDDLGPAVSNIFDSYQVYAGHEIGLVTDFVTVAEIRDLLVDIIEKEQGVAIVDGGDGGDKTTTTIETQTVTHDEWVTRMTTCTNVSHSYMKDLGQIFANLSHTDAVKKRHSIAKTMKLVPSARPLRLWVEQNKDNPSFREKLGLR